jgi:hypothetical protein
MQPEVNPFTPNPESFGFAIIFLTAMVYLIRLVIPHAISPSLLLRGILLWVKTVPQSGSSDAQCGASCRNNLPPRPGLSADRFTADEEKRLLEVTGQRVTPQIGRIGGSLGTSSLRIAREICLELASL